MPRHLRDSYHLMQSSLNQLFDSRSTYSLLDMPFDPVFPKSSTLGDGPMTSLAATFSAGFTAGTPEGDVLGGTGHDDRIFAGAGADTLFGSHGDDVLFGEDGDDRLHGGIGDDRLDGGAGDDVLRGGAGDDTYVVDAPGDIVVERDGAGIDTSRSSVDYTLPAHVERLTLTGDADIAGTGNALDNVLTGNSGENILAGGLGDDIYVVRTPGHKIVEETDEGTDTVRASVSYALPDNVENLTLLNADLLIGGRGNALDNVLTGNWSNNVLRGGGGDDTIDGGLGSDKLFGGAGDDTLQGGSVNDEYGDILYGGAGDDTYLIGGCCDVVLELAGEGTDTVKSPISFVLPQHVENLTLTGDGDLGGSGNHLDNVLTGNVSDNTLSGRVGDDWLDGGGGSDAMRGGPGNDSYIVDSVNDDVMESPSKGNDTVHASIDYELPDHVENVILSSDESTDATGNAADNVIRGNGWNNTLAGGAGDDSLEAGWGADVLDGEAGDDTLDGGPGDDVYLFARGHGHDTIVGERRSGGADTVRFADVLSTDELGFARDGDHLDVTITGTPDRLTVEDWYAGAVGPIETFATAGGEELLAGDIDALVQAMAA